MIGGDGGWSLVSIIGLVLIKCITASSRMLFIQSERWVVNKPSRRM